LQNIIFVICNKLLLNDLWSFITVSFRPNI